MAKLYAIPPLDWEQTGFETCHADVPPFGRIEIVGVYPSTLDEFQGFMFRLPFIPHWKKTTNGKVYKSMTVAMRGAEAFYRKWLEKALTTNLEN